MDNTAQNLSSQSSSNSSSTQQQKGPVDMNWIVSRATSIMKDPKGIWTTIKNEEWTIPDLYKRYIIILAALGPIASFIGLQMFGISVPFYGTYRPPFFSSLVSTVLMYGVSLGTLYVAAMIVSALAPKFEGNADQTSALKLVAFSATASQVGGILSLIPVLGILGILFGIYSLYTLYQGIPSMTGVPPAKQVPYFAVTIVSIIVVGVVLAVVVGLLVPVAAGPDIAGQVPKSLEDATKMLETLVPKGR